MNVAPDAELEFRLFPALRCSFPLGAYGSQNGRAVRNGDVVGGVKGDPALVVEPTVHLGPVYFLAIFVHQRGLDHAFGLLLTLVGVRCHEPGEELIFDVVSSAGDEDDGRGVPGVMYCG
jgi:hypothetical protein